MKTINNKKTVRKSRLVDSMRTKDSLTENGCVTHSTSNNACVDLFFIAGASRTMVEKTIINMFVKALNENPLVAMKILFWARDIRGGEGERRFFRVIAKYLDENYPKQFKKNIKFIPEYGRWDDMFELDEKFTLPLIVKGLRNDEVNGLLAKWLPRQGEFANKVRKHMGLTPKGYRKMVVALSNTIEQKMSSGEFGAIEYDKIPSLAMNKYRKAFFRNDEARFKEFLGAVEKGEKKIHASTLTPLDLYVSYSRGEDKRAVEVQWNALPDYMKDSKERVLPMCDVSESMGRDMAMAASISLGIYISERNRGLFKNAFMTFTSEPTLQYLTGSFYERINQIKGPRGYNTDLIKAFLYLLSTAIKHNLPESEMPTKILIISDMEFDGNEGRQSIVKADDTAYEAIVKNYKVAGYKVPQIVFWNVRGREDNVPVKVSMKGVGLVSGYNPSKLPAIIKGEIETPEQLMLKIINSERYSLITV